MKRRIQILLSLTIALTALVLIVSKKKSTLSHVELTNTIDEDIVLVNLGEANREQIAMVLSKIDSCGPKVIGVDVFFFQEKGNFQDSILSQAFEVLRNDIIAYSFDSAGTIITSIPKIRNNASDEGYTDLDDQKGLSSNFVPIIENGNNIYESFALRIVRAWKPEFKHTLQKNKSIPIRFRRTLSQFNFFYSGDFDELDVCSYLKNKIVLVGYLGPSSEDKHFTPIRFKVKYKEGEPDTYGLVIIANEIRTILDFEKK